MRTINTPYLGEKSKEEKEVVLAAVTQNYKALLYADPTMKADKKVVLAAVKQNGEYLLYADPTMKGTVEAHCF